ncbi:hypothetical protein QBC36DRAFT_347746 [Triangularia setosa]|uniref:Azaphilone pigments biosynthesis cluster protein L N-terminal domain-containing protein n=1 Tax=Triangularia setosa TaxID=2587417 RepID=A0AAN6W456_9PEZI|nr:hypothetical protein QBC36DRAFT_347746 [Podospora setosa]
MDPLSVTAGVVALATAALQSAKALCDLIDGLVDAPHSVLYSKSLLSQTQTTLGTLARTLKNELVYYNLQPICQGFTPTMIRVTSHSTDSRFSKHDGLVVYFKDTKMSKLNRDLVHCQRTITMVLSSITLTGFVSSHTSGNIDQLRTQFATQEKALVDLSAQLSIREPEPQADDDGITAEGGSSAQLTDSLRDVCQKTFILCHILSAVHAQQTGQKFSDMKTGDHSIAMQRIVGMAQPGVDPSFSSLATTTSSHPSSFNNIIIIRTPFYLS